MKMEQQIKVGLGHIAKGFQIMADALIASGAMDGDPTPQTQNPATSAAATTARAKKAADKAAKEKAEAQTEEKTETEVETKVETKAETSTEKKKTTKKKDEPEFETLDRDGKIEHLRGRMVMVAQKLNGDRDKVYSFLKKYKATKVNELSDENLVLLKEDIEVFLGGPDALDI